MALTRVARDGAFDTFLVGAEALLEHERDRLGWLVERARKLGAPRSRACAHRGVACASSLAKASRSFGEPAADSGEELISRPGRRRPIEFEIPAIVALLAEAAAVAPQPLGEQDSAQLVRCADPHPTSV
jgi:hypothetical protein